jgi:hypothetical protein
MLVQHAHGPLLGPEFQLDFRIDFPDEILVAALECGRSLPREFRQPGEVALDLSNDLLLA